MARKRRAPSPPPQESDTDAEEHAADSSDGEPGSDVDLHAFQMRPVPHPGSEADESSESESEVPEPVQKKAAEAATTRISKDAVPADKKRPAPEPAPSGRAKRANAGAWKATSEAAPAGKGKNSKAEQKKAAPEATPAAKGKKAKKSVGKSEDPGLDASPPSKPARAKIKWPQEDLIKILEAMAAYVKTEGALPKTDVLIATLDGRLERKDCSYTDMYERVRRFKERYQQLVSDGVVPSEGHELQVYNLSEAIWGEKAKEAMAAVAAASQNDPTATKSKKGQAKKEKLDGNSKAGTVSEVPNQSADSQKGNAVEVETDKDVNSKLSKEDTAAASPSMSKKLGYGNQEQGKDAKSGTLKESAITATQDGDDMTKCKMDIDPVPKETSTDNQNRGAHTEEETHQEETEIGGSVRGAYRSFDELQGLYPCLAGCVKRIEAEHPCGETLKRAFGFIGNDKAKDLESRIKDQKLQEVKAQIRLQGLQKEVLKLFL